MPAIHGILPSPWRSITWQQVESIISWPISPPLVNELTGLLEIQTRLCCQAPGSKLFELVYWIDCPLSSVAFMWAGFATRNDPRLENMLVRKDGWADFKRAREVPEIKEAALSWPRGYSFAVAYAYLLIFAAIRALVTKDSWIVEYGKSLSPNFIRANVWTLQGALWISLAYYIFRRRRRAIPLLFATVLAGCISIVVHGIRPSDVILCLPDVAILLYLSNYKHVLREDDVSTSEGTNPTVHQNLVGVLIRERLVAGVAFFTASFCIVWLALRGETLQSADPEKIWEAIGSSVFLATGYAWLIWQAFFHARKGTVVLSCFAALLIGAVLFSLWAH